MRSRNIKPGFFVNDELAELTPLTRLLFIGMWCMADRSGRMKDRPKKIKAEVLPFDDCNICAKLESLATMGFIVRYTVAGKNYIQINHFAKHQSPHVKEVKSDIPPAPDKPDTSTRQAPDKPDTNPPDCGLLIVDCGLMIPDSNIKPRATTTGEQFRNCFEEKGEHLKSLYPHADYEAEKETCIAEYQSQAVKTDPYLIILKWFNRIPKPSAAKAKPKTFEEIKIDNTKAGMISFVEGAPDGRYPDKQNPLCIAHG